MNENDIQITIGIPVYNVERYVERSLRSALDQDFSQPYNILVVDDCGTDASMDIVRRVCEEHPHGDRVTIFRHDGNKGLGAARNTIIDHADGKYLFFLDSDDWITPDCLSKHYEVAEKYQAEFTCGSIKSVSEATGEENPYYQYNDEYWENEAVGCYLQAKGKALSVAAWNKLYRLDFLRQHNLRTIHRIYEDQWLAYTMWLYARKVVLLSAVTLYYNVRTSSIMTSMYGKKGTDESYQICCDVINRLHSLISEKFPNVYGAYDLYYRAVRANLSILVSAIYTEEQQLGIQTQLLHAARQVPSLGHLHSARNRFIYLCSLLYDRTYTFYRYDNLYTKFFGPPKDAFQNFQHKIKKILFITHEASRTGAPLVLLSLVKSIGSMGGGVKLPFSH